MPETTIEERMTELEMLVSELTRRYEEIYEEILAGPIGPNDLRRIAAKGRRREREKERES